MSFPSVAVVYLCLIAFGSFISPFDPSAAHPENSLQAPNFTHWAGTDLLGRDVLSRALHGGQHTLVSAGLAAMLALAIGIVIGLRSGRSAIDRLMDALIDVGVAMPVLLVAFMLITLLGNTPASMILAVSAGQIAPIARVTRRSVQFHALMPHIEAARAYGASEFRLLWCYLLPNALPGLAAYGCTVFAACILNGAALSFFGFGGEPGRPDWGVMLYEARQVFRTAPWVGVLPGLGITIAILLLNETATRLSRQR